MGGLIVFTFYLNDLERSMSRSLRFGTLISHELLIQVCSKLPCVIPTAGVKQRAIVLGSLSEELMISKVVRRRLVHVAIISVSDAQISCCFLWTTRWDNFLIFPPKIFFDFLLWIFFVFVNMGAYGSENFKTLLLLQIAVESFHTSPEISSQWSSQKYCLDFCNFDFTIF